MRFLLGTNILSALFKRESSVLRAAEGADTVLVPSIVVGEYVYGAPGSAHPDRNLAALRTFLQSRVVLPCTNETGEVYGGIKATLRARGRPIPDNDIWIAALAMQHDLILITRDAHFEHVDGLKREAW